MARATPSRKNLFGFGAKPKPKSKHRSSATLGAALSKARAAGKASGDTGLFGAWLESTGLDHRSDTVQKRLRVEYERGVEDNFVKRGGFKGKGNPDYESLKRKAELLAAQRTKLYALIEGRDKTSASSKAIIRQIHAIDRKIHKVSFDMAHAQNPSIRQSAIDTLDTADAITGAVYQYTVGLPSTAIRKLLTSKNPDRERLIQEAQTSRNIEELARLHKWAIGHRDNELRTVVEKRARDLGIKISRLTAAHPRKWNPRTSANPQESADYFYEKFHGRAPEEHIDVEETVHEHEWLGVLGSLTDVTIDTPTGLRATIEFDEKNCPWLCSTEDGSQLYVRGGDQKIDLKSLKMDGDDWKKERMVLGQFAPPEPGRGQGVRKHSIAYTTEKSYDDWETIIYQHDFAEEFGERPYLEYEPRNELLYITGGQYKIKLPLIGTSPGIEN